MSFAIHPVISRYKTVKEFAAAAGIGAGDLLVTNRILSDALFAPLELSCDFLFQEDFGTGEPTDDMIDRICAAIADKGYTRIIAVGGGSIIDISKILALKNPGSVVDLVDGSVQPVREKKLLLVPATCGTGSEVTNLTVLALTKRGTKVGFGRSEMFADEAVLIPELLATLPLKVFAASSIDAFIHAIESRLSPNATPETRMFSERAMALILRGYLRMEKEGNDARFAESENFLTAALYGGIAFGNAGTGAVHATSYPVGATYHVPHGESNYAMFPAVFRAYMAKDPNGRIREVNEYLASILGCDPAEVYTVITRLFDRVLPAKRLSSYGMKEDECEIFAASVIQNQQRLIKNNYVPFTEEEYAEIYRSVY